MGCNDWRFTAMASPCLLHLESSSGVKLEAVAAAALAEVRRIEAKFSRYRDDSVVSAINRSAGNPCGVEVDEETSALLDYAATGFRISGGLFDITSGVYRRVWDFRHARLPDQQALDSCRRLVGWNRVVWKRPQLKLPLVGMEIDFGGFGKEYAADRVVAACRNMGVDIGFVNLGGDIAVIGSRLDGKPWRVGIQHPRHPKAAFAQVDLASGALATSGDYERFFVHAGKRYCHILNPMTGWPVQSHRSVSVVAELCVVAGTLSSTGMLCGESDPAWLLSTGTPHLLVHQDGRISGNIEHV